MNTLDAIQTAVIGIGSIGFMPLAVVTLKAIASARRERRRQAMLYRHWRNHL